MDTEARLIQPLDVLIVDDEAGMRAGAARSLENFIVELSDFKEKVSFKVRLAETGEAALAEIRNKQPDIILLDYKLPDMTGIDLLEAVPAPKDFLTIMITAFASLEVAVTATKRGAFDFLAKPFTPEELRATAQKAARHIYLHRKARQLEEEKKQVRFEFISILAHELKSPLSAVEGYVRLMQDRAKGPDLAGYESMLDRSVIRISGMRKLVMDLLDLTRLESGKKIRVFEQINLTDKARTVIEDATAQAAAKEVRISLKAPDGLYITADAGEVEIILTNLLTNAVKYNKRGGTAELELLKADNNRVIIRCSDTGIGMTEEELGRLFGEFVRMKNEHTRSIDGSGLGLSILKKIVKLYEGEVSVKSKYGEGTTFELVLKDSSLIAV